MRNSEIFGAVIGLAGAVENNGKTENTDRVILNALAYTGENESEQVELVRKEKFTISPDCAVCTHPCGNTSDHDMRMITEGQDVLSGNKRDCVAALQKLAIFLINSGCEVNADTMELFYEGIALVVYDYPESEYPPFVEKIMSAAK